MFELFKYFIYVIRGSLDNFDPLTDMLVDSGVYLTWRRYNDEVPTGGVPYAGAIKDTQLDNWVVLRFNRRLYYEGVEDWLKSQASGNPTLGTYKPSAYRGLFHEQPPHFDIPLEAWHEHKLPTAQAFFREVWGGWPAWLARELEVFDTPTAKWDHIRYWLVKILLGERGVRA